MFCPKNLRRTPKPLPHLMPRSHMCRKPRLWWLLETHVAFRRLWLFLADWLVPEGGAHNVAVGEVFREFLPVGGGSAGPPSVPAPGRTQPGRSGRRPAHRAPPQCACAATVCAERGSVGSWTAP